MKCLIVVRVLAVALPALAVGACQVTPEFVRALLCEPADPVPAEPAAPVVEPEPFGS